jgi:hypothetical protein
MARSRELWWFAPRESLFALLLVCFCLYAGSARAQTVTVNTASPAAGAKVSVTVANGPGSQRDWLGLALSSDPNNRFIQWKYLSNTQSPPPSGIRTATVTFDMPSSPGTYQFRFFANDGFTRLAQSADVRVGAASIKVSTSSAAPGASVSVTVANGPANQRDWVGLALASDPDKSFVDWKYLNNAQSPAPSGMGTATLTFAMPSTPGTYQFRFFANDSFARLASSAGVTVAGSPPPIGASPLPPAGRPSVSVNTTSTAANERVSVVVSNGPGTGTDWVALAPVSAPNTQYLQWKYLNNTQSKAPTGITAATLTFDMPPSTGVYEFRLFAGDGFTRLADSADVTVSAPAPTPSPSPSPQPSPTPSGAYEGFGAVTRGGEGQPIYRVTNLNNSGPGSLREALKGGNRYIVFDVGGTINITTAEYVGNWYWAGLPVWGAHVTIDATTAPAPGITIQALSLPNTGNSGVVGMAIDSYVLGSHDVIVKGIRFRNVTSSSATCLSIGSHNVIVDHVSTAACGKNGIDLYGDSKVPVHDITVQNSIIGPNNPSHNLAMDINRNEWNITLHHNLIIGLTGRMPKISRDQRPSADTTVDMRNNVIWDWNGGRATTIMEGAKVNVVNNLFYTPPADGGVEWGLQVCTGVAEGTCAAGSQYAASAYTAGNVSLNGRSYSDLYNSRGERSAPFTAAPVKTTDACTAARAVVAGSGARPLDGVDRNLIAQVDLSGCP